MARFCGIIGFASTEQTIPGVWSEKIIEKRVYGDVIKNRQKTVSSNINTESIISNEFSILANPYIQDNIPNIRYIQYRGVKWNVSSVDIEYPRLILSLGGVYNEQET